MTATTRKRPTSVVTGPRRTPIEKLELIYALVAEPSKTTPSLLRIKILAICEGRAIPTEKKAFVALAMRAGVSRAKGYTAWQEWCKEFPTAAAADDGPQETALYRWRDDADLLLYVGIAGNLGSRTKSHVKGSSWMEFVAGSSVERFPSRQAALDAEEAAIKAEYPLFNKQHNDTPEARRRAVEYLIEHDRLDLLALAA